MNRFSRPYRILLALALIACAVVIVAEFHKHADDASGHCWLCISSFGSTVLPAAAGLVVVAVICMGLAFVSAFHAHSPVLSAMTDSRAPPSISPLRSI